METTRGESTTAAGSTAETDPWDGMSVGVVVGATSVAFSPGLPADDVGAIDSAGITDVGEELDGSGADGAACFGGPASFSGSTAVGVGIGVSVGATFSGAATGATGVGAGTGVGVVASCGMGATATGAGVTLSGTGVFFSEVAVGASVFGAATVVGGATGFLVDGDFFGGVTFFGFSAADVRGSVGEAVASCRGSAGACSVPVVCGVSDFDEDDALVGFSALD
jgi:hypothetical protein